MSVYRLTYRAVNLHYLSDGFDIDVTLPADLTNDQLTRLETCDFDALKQQLGAREIQFMRTVRNTPHGVLTESNAGLRPE